MAALRCSLCNTNWPVDAEHFAFCPCCEGKTARFSNAEPLDHDEAMSLKRQFDFERFYEQRESTLPPLELR